MATERSGQEHMNKSKEQMRKDRRTRVGKREEEEKEERRANTWNPDRNNQGSNASDRNIRGSMSMRKHGRQEMARRA